jgi:hypothetical protein
MRGSNTSSSMLMTPRFGIVLEAMHQAGFHDFEEMVIA